MGGIETEHEAALIYDKNSILVKGLKSKTNFSYTKNEILHILKELHEHHFKAESKSASH
jgi:hypothetical protein